MNLHKRSCFNIKINISNEHFENLLSPINSMVKSLININHYHIEITYKHFFSKFTNNCVLLIKLTTKLYSEFKINFFLLIQHNLTHQM